jgi:Anti-sigma-K factor rskA/Putative zinc-finger
MKDHAQFAEDLALYAMGALDNQQCPELQAHLAECVECRRELEVLRADMALLALSATGPQPPQRSRQRLIEAFAAKPREAQKAAPPLLGPAWPRWLFWAPLAASLLLAFHTVFLWQAHQRAHRDYEKLQAQLQEERQRNTHAKAVLDMMNSPTVQRMTLVSVRKPPQPQVKTFYEKTSGHVLLLAGNLEPIPDDKVYELWLMPMSGEPMPAGTFRIEADGSAMMLHSMDTEGIEAKGFAITVEPLRGSKSPTLPIRYAPAG